ncbi:preprotein translocase subunit YajC [Thermodesulfobacterium hydrogeniphilum]|uniref:preprotein translocase subunit YajC n=1 Tax=Thermodesulfobacterium hydrogeniphilum TaxID=161156 RepID=UPI000A5429EC|nr:preprotein translocase subunit YajC [Thermodesulfobacterium hydrogeniphilum]
MGLLNFLIGSVWAMGAPQGQAPQGGGLASFVISLIPLFIIFLIFYFLLIRPQQKRMKEHQQFLAQLRPGLKVITSGGIVGKVVKIEGDIIWLEVDKDINIPVVKGYIAGPFNQ